MKSHARGPLSKLVPALLRDAGNMCDVGAASIDHDLKTMRLRLKHEGESFLTITLPAFCSNFERSIAEGKVTPQFSYGYRKTGCLPSFLRGFTELVFDSGTGLIREEPNEDAVKAIRQLCLFAKKVSLPCSPKREKKAIEGFVSIEQDLELLRPEGGLLEVFKQVSCILWRQAAYSFRDSGAFRLHTTPKHGPGATCERISGNQKYVHKSWHARLERIFPLDLHAYPNVGCMLRPEAGLASLALVSQEDELPVRVTLVPKTLKGPRIIAIEPVCMQYTQQVLSRWLMHQLETDGIVGGHVNFTDQTINQRMAMKASADGSLATLDLSSASDRVPLDMIQTMLHDAPELYQALEACRSRRAKLPDGRIIPLKKFASMGSATCFPVESMYFLTVVLTALADKHGGPISEKLLKKLVSRVYVYGDDIIVPVDTTEAVIAALTSFGCKVNSSKSFWTGQFRESCGMDAFNGYRVTPIYVRCLPPRSRRDARAIISWTEASNLLYRNGFWLTADYMKNVVESVIGKLPIVAEDSGAVGLTSFQKNLTVHGWNKDHMCAYVRAYVAEPVYTEDVLEGYGALLKCLLLLEESSSGDPLVPRSIQKDHLVRSSRHGASRIKRRRLNVS